MATPKGDDEGVDTGEAIQFRLELKGQLRKDFLAIKQRRGVVFNTELVRMLISDEATRLRERKEIR